MLLLSNAVLMLLGFDNLYLFMLKRCQKRKVLSKMLESFHYIDV